MTDSELRKAGLHGQPSVEVRTLACFFTELFSERRGEIFQGRNLLEFRLDNLCIQYTSRSEKWWIWGDISALKGLVSTDGVIKALNILRKEKFPNVEAKKLFAYFLSMLEIARQNTLEHYNSSNW